MQSRGAGCISASAAPMRTAQAPCLAKDAPAHILLPHTHTVNIYIHVHAHALSPGDRHEERRLFKNCIVL